ncbi:MAG: hypothetical protein CBC23_004490 [Rhodospirillaceae bacterium TMED63]|nr:hypothetical protein [Rhodospirillaceae bacterium]RPG01515.1 MAG: hypothetical protein CBC23_004490 [Rhodospirillaceae bacterium TMED63]
MIAAPAIATILAVRGLGILMPLSLRAHPEMRKENPDPEKIQRMMRIYLHTPASQDVFQVLIVIVKVKFAIGAGPRTSGVLQTDHQLAGAFAAIKHPDNPGGLFDTVKDVFAADQFAGV